MPIFAVIRKSDQVEVWRYSNLEVVEWPDYPFAEYDHVQVVVPVEPPPPPAPVLITKLAFRNRFTQSEKIAIEIAALDNPAAPIQQRAMAAALRANQQDVSVATFIDLNRPDTRAGVQSLEAAGLIAVGRSTVILDTSPTEIEVYRA